LKRFKKEVCRDLKKKIEKIKTKLKKFNLKEV